MDNVDLRHVPPQHQEKLVGAMSAGLNWAQIISLLLQFGQTYGPEVLTIAVALIAAVKAHASDPAALLRALADLAAQYGPDIYQMATVIAGWFGFILPPLATGH
jgi:hypothetical protein